MSVLGESYKFYRTSQSNKLAEETGVAFDHATSSFCLEISINIKVSKNIKGEFFEMELEKNFEKVFRKFLTLASGICWLSINYSNNNWPEICFYFDSHVFNQWKFDFYVIHSAERN